MGMPACGTSLSRAHDVLLLVCVRALAVLGQVPIHRWLQPWLPLLGVARMQPLLPVIRHKLASALVDWAPSDPSAHVVLAPWHGVFEPSSWERLMLEQIVPKLAGGLRTLDWKQPTVSEAARAPFSWTQRWADVLPRGAYLRLVVHELLWPWLQALHGWLRAGIGPGGVDLAAVNGWYEGWKEALGEELQQQPAVQGMLGQALRMFTQLLEGQTPAAPSPPPASGATAAGLRLDQATGGGGGSSVDIEGSGVTYKDLVERFAAENDMVFMPTARARDDGSRIYQFGKAMVSVDTKENLVWLAPRASDPDGVWRPVGLEELLKQGAATAK
jgi:tuftelin-interacting protein 11